MNNGPTHKWQVRVGEHLNDHLEDYQQARGTNKSQAMRRLLELGLEAESKNGRLGDFEPDEEAIEPEVTPDEVANLSERVANIEERLGRIEEAEFEQRFNGGSGDSVEELP